MEAVSPAGKLVALTIVFFGMLFMAMPIAIVGSCFSQTWFDQDRIMLLDQVRSRLQAQGFSQEDLQTVFEEVDQDKSGLIEFEEFRQMIETFNLRSLNAAKIRKLFQVFDNDGDGEINFTDFCLTLYPDLSVFNDYDPVSPAFSEHEDGGGDMVHGTSDGSPKSAGQRPSGTFAKAQTEPPRFWPASQMKAAWHSRLSDPPRNHRKSVQDLRKRVHAIQRRDAESAGERHSTLSCPSSSSRSGSPFPRDEEVVSDEDMAKRVSSGATVDRLSSIDSEARARRTPSAEAGDGAGGAPDPESRGAWMTAGPSTSLDGVENISSLPSAASSSGRAPRPPPLQEEDEGAPAPARGPGPAGGRGPAALGEGARAVVHGLERSSRCSSLNGQVVTILRRSSRQEDAWLVHMPNGGRKRLPEANLRPSPVSAGRDKGNPCMSSSATAPDNEEQLPGGAARAGSPTADGRRHRASRRHRAAGHSHSGDPCDGLQSAEDILVRLEWRMKRRLNGLTGLAS